MTAHGGCNDVTPDGQMPDRGAMNETMLSNVRLVLADEVVRGHAVIQGDRLAAIGEGQLRSPAAIDGGGDWLLPGFVELHTDNLEKQLVPRPGVLWPARSALLAHDAQLLAAGITTACDALSVGDAEADSVRVRTFETAHRELAAARADGSLRIAHYLHLRAELPHATLLEMLAPLLDDPALRLLSLMDHTPGQRQYRDLDRYAEYYGVDMHSAPGGVAGLVAERRAQQARYRPRNLAAVLALARARGLRLASHDDTEPADIDEALECGATISEFPTTLAAAHAARAAGLAIVAGAPNLVRGGSHSGNVAALDLARADCLDILSSDYVPASLLDALSVLRREAGWSWPRAVAAATLAPARALGLHDRGVLAPGMRADLLRVRGDDDPQVVEVRVRGQCRLS